MRCVKVEILSKIFCILALGSGQRLLYRLGSWLGLRASLSFSRVCTSLTKPEVISITVAICLYFAMLLKGDFNRFYIKNDVMPKCLDAEMSSG